jgi:hypothetical protein
MTQTRAFTIGDPVLCSDGAIGELRRVVVEPIARVLTHLVIELAQQPGSGRLVPIDLVDVAAPGIELRCGSAEFEVLETAEQFECCPGATGAQYDGQDQQLLWPYYGLAEPAVTSLGMPIGPPPTTYDRVPRGDVELGRDEHVHATDGAIGRVRGLSIDLRDRRVTHVLLDEGHLWGHKRVAIPIQAVTTVEGGVQIDLTKRAVRELPAVDC